MKNKKFFITIILLSGLATIIFSGCSFIPSFNSKICIYDCEHGKLEVTLISEYVNENNFLVIGYPDSGYCLLASNLYIYDNNDNNKILPSTLTKKNSFQFSAKRDAKITVSAFFTKIEQD